MPTATPASQLNSGSCYHHSGLVRGALISRQSRHGQGRSYSHKGTVMKKTTILMATVAFTCLGSTFSLAQIQINGSQPRVSQRLVVAQTGIDESSDDLGTAQEVIPNPFDFFASEDPSSIPSMPAEADASPVLAEVNASPSDVDPKSLPVGRRHRQQSMTQTILDHGTVSAIPHAAMAPVCWSAPEQTPNPIASILLRQDCNEQALWNGYSAQRAAECARMWQHLSAEHRCGRCGKGGHGCGGHGCGGHGCGQSCGCASGCATGCAGGAAACAPAPRNRYTEHLPVHHHQHQHHHAAPGCDTLAPAAHGQVPTPAPHAEFQSAVEKSESGNTASLQSIAPPSSRSLNVASLPASFNR
jgi:hypothetical protein